MKKFIKKTPLLTMILKAIGKKLEDYYGDELKELDPVLKVDREQESMVMLMYMT